MLESHGLFTWADDAKDCYELTLDDHPDGAWTGLPRRPRACRPSAAPVHKSLARRRPPRRRRAADAGDPRHGLGQAAHGRPFRRQRRGAGLRQRQATWSRSPRSAPPAPTISCAPRSARWSSAFDPAKPMSTRCSTGLPAQVAAYREDYAAYYERCKHDDSPAMRDPNAVVYLVPGVGMITFAKDKATARISGEFYVNAINVMRGASRGQRLRRPARAGGLRHRILAARRGQAAADAEAEIAGRPGGAGHRRRRRHRLGHGRDATSPKAPA